MQRVRLGTTVLKALSASWFTVHFDHGTKENNDPLKCKKQKCNVDEKMRDKLREFARYVLDKNSNLYQQNTLSRPLCDCKSWFHKDCAQSKKDAETKKFNEDIIEKFEEIVRDYSSYNEKSSKSSNNQSVGTDKNGGRFENDPVRDEKIIRSICSKLVEIEDAIIENDKARVRNIEAAVKKHDQALVSDIEEAFKKTNNTPYWAGAIVGSLCVFSMALLMTSFK